MLTGIYITLVVSFASYPCNEHKTHVGRLKCESDTSIVRHVTSIVRNVRYKSASAYQLVKTFSISNK